MSWRGTITGAVARERRNLRKASAAPRRDQEFAIAVAAGNGGGDDAFDLPFKRGNERGDVVADGGVDSGIAHDTLLDMASAGFELRLDQRQQLRRPLREP